MKAIKRISTNRIQFLLSLFVILLSWTGPAYGGEWEPIVPGMVGNIIEIRIKNLEFTSAGTPVVMNNHILIIPVGMQVMWINADPLVTVNGDQGLMPHGIKVADSTEKVLMASPILTKEQNTFSYTFNKEGSFTYGCFIHSFMIGRIEVIKLPGLNMANKP